MTDLTVAEAIAGGDARGRPRTRVGTGYDLHRLVDGRPLILGGVTIPPNAGWPATRMPTCCAHAITDAILGAVGAGDIGRHFPDTDPQWKGASSLAMLAPCRGAGGRGRIRRSATSTPSSIAERPKLAPHIDAIRASLAAVLGVERRPRQRQGQDQRRRRRDRPRRGDGGARRGRARRRAAGRRSGRSPCECVSRRARPASCTSATPARRCSTGCSRAGGGGTFILRIEDTDVERSTRESEQGILDDLRWLGLDWDEGPDVGGAARAVPAVGAARTCTARTRRELIEHGARLPLLLFGRAARGRPPRGARAGPAAAVRRPVPRPAGRGRSHARLARGRAGRHPVPRAGGPATWRSRTSCAAHVQFSTDVIGDPVLVRSDGIPAYNFAVVVDDALMEITHVDPRRGSHLEHAAAGAAVRGAAASRRRCSRTSRSCSGPDHTPLSKRHGATSVAEFRARGYLPEALVNYLALLGWSPGGGDELLPAGGAGAAGSRSRTSGTAPACSTSRSSRGSTATTCGWPIRSGWRSSRCRTSCSAGFVRGADAAGAARSSASVVPMASGSVDRLEQMPARLAFLFDFDPACAALARRRAGGAAARPARATSSRRSRASWPRRAAARSRVVSRGGRAGEGTRRARRGSTCSIRSAWR